MLIRIKRQKIKLHRNRRIEKATHDKKRHSRKKKKMEEYKCIKKERNEGEDRKGMNVC